MDETRFITFPFLPTLISSIDMDDPKEFDDPQVFQSLRRFGYLGEIAPD